mmetsp:Transcript_73672/g.216175  ORF Transcript_73672/g.216175 Transcript_73672/m.216175 type:complete len:275 (-) Transcript_73672:21-845(-)
MSSSTSCRPGLCRRGSWGRQCWGTGGCPFPAPAQQRASGRHAAGDAAPAAEAATAARGSGRQAHPPHDRDRRAADLRRRRPVHEPGPGALRAGAAGLRGGLQLVHGDPARHGRRQLHRLLQQDRRGAGAPPGHPGRPPRGGRGGTRLRKWVVRVHAPDPQDTRRRLPREDLRPHGRAAPQAARDRYAAGAPLPESQGQALPEGAQGAVQGCGGGCGQGRSSLQRPPQPHVPACRPEAPEEGAGAEPAPAREVSAGSHASSHHWVRHLPCRCRCA